MRICPNCETPTLEPICPYDGYQTVYAALYMDPQQDPFVGTVFHGRYRIESRQAMGGMSTVYRATQIAVGRPVALKIMTRDLARDLKAVARFQQEARAVAGLRHPNTIRLFDYGQSEDGHLFLVMEFLDGEPLSALIDRSGPFDPARVIRIAKQLLDALSEAHGNGIVHRDLKPDNIFVTNVGLQKDYVKILDFGIAKVTKLEGRKNLTGTGLVIGSPGYMAPEQVQAQPSTPQTDIYAVGAMSYEMLCGHPIFEGESAIELAFKHVQEEPPHPNIDGEELHGPLVDFILDCLSKPMEYRPPSAAVALEQLQALEAVPLRNELLPDARTTSPGGALHRDSARRTVPPRSDSVPDRRSPTTETFATRATVRSSPSDRRSPSSRDVEEMSPSALDDGSDSYRLATSGGRAGWAIATLLVAAAVGGGVWWYTQHGIQRGPLPRPSVDTSPSTAAPARGHDRAGRADIVAAAGLAAGDASAATATTPPAVTRPTTADAGAGSASRDAARGSAATADAGPEPRATVDAGEPTARADAGAAKRDVPAESAQSETQWVQVVTSPKKAKVFINRALRGGKYVEVGRTPYRVEWKKGGTPPRVMLKKYHYEVEKKKLRDWHHTKTLKFRMEFDDSW